MTLPTSRFHLQRSVVLENFLVHGEAGVYRYGDFLPRMGTVAPARLRQAQAHIMLIILKYYMVARDRPIRKANRDSEAAPRVKIGMSRSESIELPTRGFSGPVKSISY